MRSSGNDVGLWLGHVRNVMFGAPRLTSFALDWMFLRHLWRCRMRPGSIVSISTASRPRTLKVACCSRTKTDRHGLPKLRIDWRVLELDWLTLSSMLRELRRAVESCGCGTIEYAEERLDHDAQAGAVPVGGHHIGTARMSESPSSGVVNADGRVHLWRIFISQVARRFPLPTSQTNVDHRGDGTAVGGTS